MKQFLKDNLAIIAAIILPLLLALVFGLSTLGKTITVPPPRHDVFVATNYNNPQESAFTIDVVQNKIIIHYRPQVKDNANNYYRYTSIPRLWRIHAPDMSIEEIALREPANKKETDISIPGVTDIEVSNLQPGPDGYTLDSSYYYASGNFMAALFADNSRARSSTALIKDGRIIPIRGQGTGDWYYNSRFIGWVATSHE